jgi:predicted DNA-binding ribbon-helix-helix protein
MIGRSLFALYDILFFTKVLVYGSKGADMTTTTLYEKDFVAWTQAQADLLRQAQFNQLDIANLVEEIEDMGKNRQRELSSRLQVLLSHLLKWQYQPERRSPSWEIPIQLQRAEIMDLLTDNPSLRPQVADFVLRAYPKARLAARGETSLELKVFPTVCPYTFKEILDNNFFPEA